MSDKNKQPAKQEEPKTNKKAAEKKAPISKPGSNIRPKSN